MTSKKLIILAIVIVFVLLSIVLVYKKEGEVLPLGQGKQTYTILTDKPSEYQIMRVDVDPQNVKRGETQTVTITVKDAKNNPITKENIVQGTVFTDLKTTDFVAALVQAGGLPAGEADLTTIWRGSWTLDDTIESRYMITINAKNASSNSKVDLSFR